jgi:hypothetical protein
MRGCEAFGGCVLLRRSRRVGVGIEGTCSLGNRYQKSEPRDIKKSPFALCDCLCSGILPLERAESARTKVVATSKGATSC